MRKILSLLIIGLLVCQSAFAARVKYNTVTGEIIYMAHTKDNIVGPNEALLDIRSDVVGDISKFKVDMNGTFRKKTGEELAQDLASREQANLDKKTRKRAIMTKLGINKQELKALLELIQDGSDD